MNDISNEERPDGTEQLAQESVVWDYDGDDVVMTFTRDYLEHPVTSVP